MVSFSKSQEKNAFSSDSAEWDWLTGRKGGGTRERRGWGQFWRGKTDLARYRGIFAEIKVVQWEEFSVLPGGRRVVKGQRTEINVEKGRLSSFIKPRGMGGSQPHTEEQFVTQANQSKVESARRLEVSEVETL